ncbi:MAG: hypothetical protein ACLP4R_16565 [Solirubrobacteraceae bacterium]
MSATRAPASKAPDGQRAAADDVRPDEFAPAGTIALAGGLAVPTAPIDVPPRVPTPNAAL